MIVLWDSSNMTCRYTLIDGDESYEYEWEAGRTLARDMLAHLRDSLGEHGFALQDISGIGVFRGPGSFTGLRIGMTVLNTIASSRKIPIVGEIGDDWTIQAVLRLRDGENDQIVLPEYGGEAHITKPRK